MCVCARAWKRIDVSDIVMCFEQANSLIKQTNLQFFQTLYFIWTGTLWMILISTWKYVSIHADYSLQEENLKFKCQYLLPSNEVHHRHQTPQTHCLSFPSLFHLSSVYAWPTSSAAVLAGRQIAALSLLIPYLHSEKQLDRKNGMNHFITPTGTFN